MKFVTALFPIALLLTSCSAISGKIDQPFLKIIAPDTPAVSAPIQDAAAIEMSAGTCPALNHLVNICSITRDESRALRGEKTK